MDVGHVTIDDYLHEAGSVASASSFSDRHTRDDAAVARRHDVAVSVPEWDPDHILVGYGTSIHEGTTAALSAALGLD
ncbi:hypothetical protein [Halorubrum distributum]|uniref:hypothetical protein n=1 Tax=Halorubrum distributum TaxID=29283 RepID=UPI000677969B|nr:hypothetical protein [Halorubrum terrestre]